MNSSFDFTVVGGGIVGLSTAWALAKEHMLASHQTGRNSGVIHSGIYCASVSLNGQFARAGSAATVRFCKDHAINHQICGKVIAATDCSGIPRMKVLHDRALQNGVQSELLDPLGIGEHEPDVYCVAGLWIPEAGITDYAAIARGIGELVKETARSFSKAAFTRSLQRLVPFIQSADLVPSAAGCACPGSAPGPQSVA